MENSTGPSGPAPRDRAVASVLLAEASAAQRPLVERLFQFYLHDFSEHLPRSSPWGEVDEEGRFVHPPGLLDPYWQEPGHLPLLIRAESRVAGFALLNRHSVPGLPLDHAVADFFVLRKYRRAGVGTRAAHLAFRRHPGRWEVAVNPYNPNALPFWRSAIRALPAATGLTEQPGDGQRWSGTALRFEVAPPA